jgi:hypothetical protein
MSVGGVTFALTLSQKKLLVELVHRRGMYIAGSQVRSARVLSSLGALMLRVVGPMGSGERWYAELCEGVELVR